MLGISEFACGEGRKLSVGGIPLSSQQVDICG
jgi:hypothetical protein